MSFRNSFFFTQLLSFAFCATVCAIVRARGWLCAQQEAEAQSPAEHDSGTTKNKTINHPRAPYTGDPLISWLGLRRLCAIAPGTSLFKPSQGVLTGLSPSLRSKSYRKPPKVVPKKGATIGICRAQTHVSCGSSKRKGDGKKRKKTHPKVVVPRSPHVRSVAEHVRHQARPKVTGEVDRVAGLPTTEAERVLVSIQTLLDKMHEMKRLTSKRQCQRSRKTAPAASADPRRYYRRPSARR